MLKMSRMSKTQKWARKQASATLVWGATLKLMISTINTALPVRRRGKKRGSRLAIFRG